MCFYKSTTRTTRTVRETMVCDSYSWSTAYYYALLGSNSLRTKNIRRVRMSSAELLIINM